MIALARLRDALGMTLCVYGFRTATAALLAWPVFVDLSGVLREHLYRSELGPAEIALVLEIVTQNGYRYLSWAAGCVAGHALLTPLISLAWLCALRRRQAVTISLAQAFGAYLPALALGAAALCAVLATAGVAVLALSATVSSFLPAAVWIETAHVALVAGFAAFAVLVIGTSHDLARAALAHGVSLLSSLRAMLRLTTAPMLALHALAAAIAFCCMLVAEVLARALPDVSHLIVLATQQMLVLGATLVRGAWLALAVERLAATPSYARRL